MQLQGHGRGPRTLVLRVLGRLGALRLVRTHGYVAGTAGRIRVPVEGGVGLHNLMHADPALAAGLRAGWSIRSGSLVDVGAHLGETLVGALSAGLRGPYLGFEPQAEAAAYVHALLAANAVSGSVVCAAASDSAGVAVLRSSGASDDAASVVAEFRPEAHYADRRVVPTVAVDEAVEAVANSPVGILKIDAEGAELEVVRGARRTIERDRPVMLCEVLPIGDPEHQVGALRGERAAQLLDLVGELGYRALRLVDGGAPIPIDRIESPGDFAERDYAFVPADDVAAFTAAVR